MHRRAFLALTGSVAVCALLRSFGGGLANPAQGVGVAQTQAIATAATAFLNKLSDEQRAAVRFAFEPQPKATAAHFRGGMRGDVDMVGEQYGRAIWSNFPVSDVPRPGLRYGSLDAMQQVLSCRCCRSC